MYEVINLSWTRANLEVQINEPNIEQAVLSSDKKQIALDVKDGRIFIPFTNLKDEGMIEEGRWYILIKEKSREGFRNLTVDSALIKDLDDKSRIMKYASDNFALLLIPATDEDLKFYIDANYMMRNKKYKKSFRAALHSSPAKKISGIMKMIAVKFLNLAYHLLYFFNKNRNLVLFLSENSDNLSNNFKNLYEYISKEHKTITFNHNLESINAGRGAYRFWELLACSKARYIILDNYAAFLSAIKIPESQVLIQIWHAGVGFKSVGYARFGKPGSPHPFVSVHRQYDYVFVDDARLIDIYSEVFGIDKSKFTVSGLPRLENYTNKSKIDETVNTLFKALPYLQGKKTILFSPTFRGSHSYNSYYDYSKLNFKRINDFCVANDFIFIIKMHPFITEKPAIDDYPNIVDLSDYDINDLIYISDIMITDYSSCCYEFSFFNRPLIFYRYDKTIYEYLRPTHTLDMFTEKQYEVTSFDDLMDSLDKVKDIDISKRFENICERKKNSLEIISGTIFGDKS